MNQKVVWPWKGQESLDTLLHALCNASRFPSKASWCWLVPRVRAMEDTDSFPPEGK